MNRRQSAIVSLLCACIAAMSAVAAADTGSAVRDAGQITLDDPLPTRSTPQILGQSPAPSAATSPVLTTAMTLTIADRGEVRVIPVGVTKAGAVRVPRDVNVLGWYRFSSPAGSETGRTVIVGHRDGRGQGAGFFHALPQVGLGTRITITVGEQIVNYRVIGRTSIDRDRLPEALFRRSGPHQLVLISCAGAYVEGRGYEQNVIVIAEPET